MWWIALVSQTGFTGCNEKLPQSAYSNSIFRTALFVLNQPMVCLCWICTAIHAWTLSTTWAGAALLIIRSWHNNLITSDILIFWVGFCRTSVHVPTLLWSEHSWCIWCDAFRCAARGVITVQTLTDFYCFDDALHRNSSNPSSILLPSVCEATRRTHCHHCLKSADGKKLHAIYTVTPAWSWTSKGYYCHF